MIEALPVGALSDVAHHGFSGSTPGKLSFFLCQGLDLGEHGHFLSFRSESKEADSPALGSASGRT
ncbi:MAG: hypothetical protein R3E39_30540 [Anaerolineae bacterium]